MRVRFDKADFGALAVLWQSFFVEKYHVDAELLKANTVDSPLFDWGASCIEIEGGKPVGFVAVKKSANPKLFRGPDPDQAHITALAYTEPHIGVDLMAFAKGVLRDRGAYKVVFGQDSRHFFPGCPSDCTSLRDFLIIEGFVEGGEVVDLECDLSGYQPPAGALEALKSADDGGATSGRTRVAAAASEVRLLTEEDLPLLRIFLNREFPGRWSHDVLNKIEVEGRPDIVYGLFLDKSCEGFALVQDSSHKLPVGGAVWHKDLGPDWASMGPIGVSKAKRGLGFGDALLAATLTGLRTQGVKRCIVDWTNLRDFYERHGFQVCRTYRPFTLRLDMLEEGLFA